METDEKGQRYVIWFLWKQNKSGAQIIRELREVYKDHCFSDKTIYNWIQRFQEGVASVNDQSRSGRPCSSTTTFNIDRVREKLDEDRRLTVEQLALALGMPTSTVHVIISEHLGMHRIVARWVPKLLSDQQKRDRVSLSRDCLARYNTDPAGFLSRIVTGDESWFYYYDPETKFQSSEWHLPNEPAPIKAKVVQSAGKRMATVFWDMNGILLLDWLPEGRTINSERYIEILAKLKDAIKDKRRGKWSRHVLLHHDNAPAHTSHATQAAITELGYEQLPHPPYSPDLAPSDYWLFGKMKEPLRGKHFANASALGSAISQWVKHTPEEWFAEGIKKMPERWEKCIALKGDYFEKCHIH